jgi:hypothetical protein
MHTHYFTFYFLLYVLALIEPSSGRYKARGLYMIFEHTFSLGTAYHASLHVQDAVVPDKDLSVQH